MNKIPKLLLHFVISALICAVIACLFHTQMVLLELQKLDVVISLTDRLSMSLQDLAGLLPTYGSIVGLGLALGFTCAWLLRKFTRFNSFYLYSLAGATAMLVILLAMQPIMNITFLAGARSLFGICLQVLAGLIGGLCFTHFQKSENRQSH